MNSFEDGAHLLLWNYPYHSLKAVPMYFHHVDFAPLPLEMFFLFEGFDVIINLCQYSACYLTVYCLKKPLRRRQDVVLF